MVGAMQQVCRAFLEQHLAAQKQHHTAAMLRRQPQFAGMQRIGDHPVAGLRDVRAGRGHRQAQFDLAHAIVKLVLRPNRVPRWFFLDGLDGARLGDRRADGRVVQLVAPCGSRNQQGDGDRGKEFHGRYLTASRMRQGTAASNRTEVLRYQDVGASFSASLSNRRKFSNVFGSGSQSDCPPFRSALR